MIRDSSAFARLAVRLEHERADAVPLAEMIAADPDRYLDLPLPAAWRNVGLVSGLINEAREELERSPERSLKIAQLALSIALALPESYPRVLRKQAESQAWKELSNAHRYRSDYEAALRALDEGDRCVDPEPALGHDHAVLRLARAITYRELDRTSEALECLQEAAETFREFTDHVRLAQCELVVGMIHYRLGERTSARQAFMRVISAARNAGDLQTVAAAYNNLGHAASSSGEVNAAMDAFHQARAIFGELGMPGEVARVKWGMGSALLAAGRFDDSLTTMRQARETFASLAMPEESGLVGIEIAEALLAMHQRTAAHEVLVAVVEEFRNAKLSERALQAVAYLRDVADAATPASARHVAQYVRQLKIDPTLLFLPQEM